MKTHKKTPGVTGNCDNCVWLYFTVGAVPELAIVTLGHSFNLVIFADPREAASIATRASVRDRQSIVITSPT